MVSNNIEQRKKLVLKLFSEINKIYGELSSFVLNVTSNSYEFYNNHLNEHKEEVSSYINDYKKNIDNINNLNSQITNNINEWYKFQKNPNEEKNLTYPVKYLFQKKKLQKKIKKINKEISNIIIDNRFILQKLENWEKEIKNSATDKLKNKYNFEKFNQLLSYKDILINDLEYLLPSVCQDFPIIIDLASPQNFRIKYL